MTDEQIIKSLECCILGDCEGCFYGDTDQMRCRDDLAQNALSLINRQKAEIERLKELNDVLETDNINANMNLEHIQYEFDLLNQEKSAVIAEAIKEFAERLKMLKCHYSETEYQKKEVIEWQTTENK